MTRIRQLLPALLAALLLLPSAAHASASGVVVSQVYGGGGNASATYSNDYVELFNAGSAPVDLSTWTVQYATAAGTSWQPTALAGSIAPGGHYLVQLASSAAVGAALPSPDATGTTNLSASSGKIALVRSATALACGASAGSCSADASVEDLVGYGAAADFEGTGSAPAGSSTEAVTRSGGGCVDTNDNVADFAAATPLPRNTASPAAPCSGVPPVDSSTSAAVDVAVDVASTLSISLDHASLSFGSLAAGDTPPPLAENVTVASTEPAGYTLSVVRSAFTPADLPLGLDATAPAGATLGSAFGSGLVAIPVAPALELLVGTTAGPSAAGGDVWPTQVGFTSPVPLVPVGHYAATVTYTVVGR